MSHPVRYEVSPTEPAPRKVRKEAREVLARGGIVALPTETVYGLAVRADLPEALENLRRVKGREADHAFTWHVATRAALSHFPELDVLVGRLAERYWPGPLTLVLHGSPPGLEGVTQGGWTGVRLPAHAAAQSLIEFCDFPIVATSANATGEPPLTEASLVAESFGSQLDLLIDAGPARTGESSSVLKVGQGHFELLREGLLSLDDLRRAAGLKIAFVCTGNTCRSPMAEALARDVLGERLGVPATPQDLARFGFEVRSAGVWAGVGSPPAEHAVVALAEQGINLSGHASRAAIPEVMIEMDRVYGLTASHVEALTQSLPPARSRHVELLDPRGEDVPDPIGGSIDDYRRCRDRMLDLIAARSAEWA